MGKASAPGKVILTGEHSVVYGKPALAAALNLRCTAEVKDGEKGLTIIAIDLDAIKTYTTHDLMKIADVENQHEISIHHGYDNLARAVTMCIPADEIALTITVNSEIPIGAGLGSSAATSVAIIAAIYDHYNFEWNLNEISQKAFEAEKVAHGTPSGIDNSVSSLGGMIHFESGEISRLELKSDIPLIIANTGVPRNTKDLVGAVREKYDKYPLIMGSILNLMSDVSRNIEKELLAGNLINAGDLFNINQGLLDAIGVNHPRLGQLIDLTRRKGALGSKLTGAGGGGCFIVLSLKEHSIKIVNALREEGIDVYETSISSRGVEVIE